MRAGSGSRLVLAFVLACLLAVPVAVSGCTSQPGTYTVKPGDTLARIATEHRTTVSALVELNKTKYPSLLSNPSLIEVGWELRVPGWGPVPSLELPKARPGKAEAAPTAQAATLDVAAAERWVFALVNEERKKAGLAPLAWNDTMAKVARERSEDMIRRGYFSHQDPVTGEYLGWTLLLKQGLPAASEAIFRGWLPVMPDRIVERWMNSPGHRAILLQNPAREGGVGYASGEWSGIYTLLVMR